MGFMAIFLSSIAVFSYFGPHKIPFYYIIISLVAAIFSIKRKLLGSIFLASSVILFANYLVIINTPIDNSAFINNFAGKKVDSKFIVMTSPEEENKSQKFLVSSTDPNIKGKTLVMTRAFPHYEYGDVIQIKGELILLTAESIIKPKKNLGVYTEFFYPEEITINEPEVKKPFIVIIREPLVKLRELFVNKIKVILPEPHSGLLTGILLGEKSDLNDDFIALLAITGLMHIIALSGYNITIIIDSLKKTLKFKSRNIAFFLPLIFVTLFVFATALSASVVRAAIMGGVLLLSKRIGKQSDSLGAILLVSTIMVALNPYILLYDIGFQLSFMAMFGIIFLAPVLESIFKFLTPGSNQILSATLAAQIMTLPLLLYYFGRISIISPIANMLVLPLIPTLMFFGFVATLVGFLSLWLANYIALIAWFILEYIINITEFLGSLKYSSVNYSLASPLIVFGFYLIIIEITLVLKNKISNAKI